MTVAALESLTVWFLAAGLVAGAYLWLIERSVAALCTSRLRLAAAGWLALRLSLALALFGAAAMQGAPALLAALTGFLSVRTAVLTWVKGH